MEKYYFEKDNYKEVFIELDDCQSLHAFTNKDWGCIFYHKKGTDMSYSSRNPNYHEANDDDVSFLLHNGEVDHYPASWTLPIQVITRAVDYFESVKSQPPFITWHEDKQKG